MYQANNRRGVSINCALVIGGTKLHLDVPVLKARPDVIVATPGRLVDHLENTPGCVLACFVCVCVCVCVLCVCVLCVCVCVRLTAERWQVSLHFGVDRFDLNDVEILILDEADRLLELGFEDHLKVIVQACKHERQTMLFSATMTGMHLSAVVFTIVFQFFLFFFPPVTCSLSLSRSLPLSLSFALPHPVLSPLLFLPPSSPSHLHRQSERPDAGDAEAPLPVGPHGEAQGDRQSRAGVCAHSPRTRGQT